MLLIWSENENLKLNVTRLNRINIVQRVLPEQVNYHCNDTLFHTMVLQQSSLDTVDDLHLERSSIFHDF